ncbi:hypothetical protein GBS0709_16550 [Edwardsiella tarda]|nr:hypothetical protein GBS0709_16550 [Edwardsiella tarda]
MNRYTSLVYLTDQGYGVEALHPHNKLQHDWQLTSQNSTAQCHLAELHQQTLAKNHTEGDYLGTDPAHDATSHLLAENPVG